jgi:hypothetical protein
MDGTGSHQVKQNKPGIERQILNVLSCMQNLALKKNEWHECNQDCLGVEALGGERAKGESDGDECGQSFYKH